MNLAFKYPIIFWNCACLINDAGGDEHEDEEEEEVTSTETYSNEIEEFTEDDSEEEVEDSYEEEDCDGYPSEVMVMKDGKKKKRVAVTNYGKIATAIGKMRMSGIKIEPPDINKSTYTFSPDAELNVIRYGFRGITRISEDFIIFIYTVGEGSPARKPPSPREVARLCRDGRSFPVPAAPQKILNS